jgi:hypothetical protein
MQQQQARLLLNSLQSAQSSIQQAVEQSVGRPVVSQQHMQPPQEALSWKLLTAIWKSAPAQT